MSKLKRYTLPIILAALALLMLVLGVLSVTVWKPPQEVSAQGSSELPFTMTRPGVLRLYERYQDTPSVRVEATAPDNKVVWLALGKPDDVNAWLTKDSYQEIVGLSDLATLKGIPHEAMEGPSQSDSKAPVPAPTGTTAQSGDISADSNPINSDMWTAAKYGRNSVSMTLTGSELDQVLLAATDGTSPAPTITLTWETPQPNTLGLIAFSLLGVFSFLAVGTYAALYRLRPTRGDSDDDDAVEITEIEDQPAKHEAPAEVVLDTLEVVEDPAPKKTRKLLSRKTKEPKPAKAEEQTLVEEEQIEELVETAPQTEQLVEAEGAAEAEQFAPSKTDEAKEPAPKRATSKRRTGRKPSAKPASKAKKPAETKPAEDEVVDKTGPAAAQETPAKTTPKPATHSKPGVEETVSTDSGMINLATMSTTQKFPTRRALREAERRGVDTLVVGDRRFDTKTGAIPIISLDETDSETTVADERALSWSQLMERATKMTQVDSESAGETESKS